MPTFLKHLRVLEADGLVTSHKRGRIRICRVNVARLEEAGSWLAEQRRNWEASTDRLADFVENRVTGDVDSVG